MPKNVNVFVCLIIYVQAVHINENNCKCARISQMAVFHLWTLDRMLKSHPKKNSASYIITIKKEQKQNNNKLKKTNDQILVKKFSYVSCLSEPL